MKPSPSFGVRERLLEHGLPLGRVVGQPDVGFGTAVAVAVVVIDHAAPHGDVGGFLVGLADRGLDRQTPGVGVVAVRVEHDLRAISATNSACVGSVSRRPLADGERGGLRFAEIVVADVFQVVHSPQYIQLARFGTFRVAHRVVRRRRFGQAGEHRGFGGRQVPERLAEVDLGAAAKPVRPLPEEDLVDVELEDVVLRKVRLDLPRRAGLRAACG
jgi:nucleoid DNA-binding protein